MNAYKNIDSFSIPGIAFKAGDDMIYAYADGTALKKAHMSALKHEYYNKYTLIDAKGNVFRIKRAFRVKYRGFFGYDPLVNINPFHKGSRAIWVDFEFEPEVTHISIAEIKNELIRRVRRKQRFWKESYGEPEELCRLIDRATDYKELFMLFN